jgi:mRNA-degrading endonuclease RelE of RelBE toxin-antitoxin system
LNTVAELPSYRTFAEKHLPENERQNIIDFLAKNPKSGDIIQGTGSIRKLGWGKGDRGKSGGVRIIYYFHSDKLPLYLVTLFAKNERDNLTAQERNDLSKLVDILISTTLEGKEL